MLTYCHWGPQEETSGKYEKIIMIFSHKTRFANVFPMTTILFRGLCVNTLRSEAIRRYFAKYSHVFLVRMFLYSDSPYPHWSFFIRYWLTIIHKLLKMAWYQYGKKHYLSQTQKQLLSPYKYQSLWFLWAHLKFAVVCTQSIEARCKTGNGDVVGAAPTGDAATTSGWPTLLLPSNVPLILESWWHAHMMPASVSHMHGIWPYLPMECPKRHSTGTNVVPLRSGRNLPGFFTVA